MLDSQPQINALLESANLSPDDAAQAARTVEQLGNVIASGHLTASEMIAALSANATETLATIQKAFKASHDPLHTSPGCVPQHPPTRSLPQHARNYIAA